MHRMFTRFSIEFNLYSWRDMQISENAEFYSLLYCGIKREKQKRERKERMIHSSSLLEQMTIPKLLFASQTIVNRQSRVPIERVNWKSTKK